MHFLRRFADAARWPSAERGEPTERAPESGINARIRSVCPGFQVISLVLLTTHSPSKLGDELSIAGYRVLEAPAMTGATVDVRVAGWLSEESFEVAQSILPEIENEPSAQPEIVLLVADNAAVEELGPQVLCLNDADPYSAIQSEICAAPYRKQKAVVGADRSQSEAERACVERASCMSTAQKKLSVGSEAGRIRKS